MNNNKIKFYEFNQDNKNTKKIYYLTIFLFVFFFILSLYLFYLSTKKTVINKLTYKSNATVNYATYYDDDLVDYDVYVRNYLSYITFSFNSNSIFDRKINGKSNYYSEAYYYVYNTGYKNEKIYISERETLLPVFEKDIINQDKIINEGIVKVDYKKYLQRYLAYKSSSKISSQALLIVEFKSNNDILVDNDRKNNNCIVKLEIPLSESTFKITSSSTCDGKTIKINELEKNSNSNKIKLVFSICSLFFSIFNFIMTLIFYVKEYKEENSCNKVIRKILKTYDNLIVEINYLPNIDGKNIIYVKSFNELLDAQMQVNMPINFIEDENSAKFMIIQNDMVWTYIINKD